MARAAGEIGVRAARRLWHPLEVCGCGTPWEEVVRPGGSFTLHGAKQEALDWVRQHRA